MPKLNLGLGGRCDYHCIFCSRGVDNYFDKIKFDFQDEYQKAARQLYGYSICPTRYKLAISRDEPANHPFLLNVIKFARKAGFREIELNTSGIRLADAGFLARLIRSGLTSVVLPVYGVTPEVHDGIVGMPGAYNILKRVIGMLKEVELEISFRTVILKQNLHEIEQLCRQYGCCPVSFPYPTDSKVRYKDLCVRLGEIPKPVRRVLDPQIPCVTGDALKKRRADKVVFVHTLNPEQTQAAVNRNTPSFKPEKCRSCKMHAKCEGIFPGYVKLYGEAEFKPV